MIICSRLIQPTAKRCNWIYQCTCALENPNVLVYCFYLYGKCNQIYSLVQFFSDYFLPSYRNSIWVNLFQSFPYIFLRNINISDREYFCHVCLYPKSNEEFSTHLLPFLARFHRLRKNIFTCLFSVHNTISSPCHEQVSLISLRFERYFFHHPYWLR